MSECKHEYVDRLAKTSVGGWSTFTKMIIYCKNCGHVSMNEYI